MSSIVYGSVDKSAGMVWTMLGSGRAEWWDTGGWGRGPVASA